MKTLEKPAEIFKPSLGYPQILLRRQHFRNRCFQFVSHIARLQPTNDCPNCGKNYGERPLPFECEVCNFQIVEHCPNCEAAVPLSDYKVLSSTLWQCPQCGERVTARYADQMFDSRGFFVQPLVELDLAGEIQPTA